MTKQEYIHCAICGGIIKDSESHNAEPVCSGRCCTVCNISRVIPARVEQQKKESDCPDFAKLRLTYEDGSLPGAEIAAGYRKDKGGATISVKGPIDEVGVLLTEILRSIASKGPAGAAVLKASLMAVEYMARKEKKDHV